MSLGAGMGTLSSVAARVRAADQQRDKYCKGSSQKCVEILLQKLPRSFPDQSFNIQGGPSD
jgi:hypothetical protein